jgi:hypothetical protein
MADFYVALRRQNGAAPLADYPTARDTPHSWRGMGFKHGSVLDGKILAARVSSQRKSTASWLNAIEGFFSAITRRRIRRGAFASVADLQDAIARYIAAHDKASEPLVWTTSARAIFDKLAKVPAASV